MYYLNIIIPKLVAFFEDPEENIKYCPRFAYFCSEHNSLENDQHLSDLMGIQLAKSERLDKLLDMALALLIRIGGEDLRTIYSINYYIF